MIQSHFFSSRNMLKLGHVKGCKKMIVLICLLFLGSVEVCSQTADIINVDLSANKDNVISIPAKRNGNACSGNNCIQFNITLNSGADLLSLSVSQEPASAGYFVNCVGPYPLSTPVCISGLTTVSVVFCKPGGNSQTFTITSSSLVQGSADLNLRQNCSGTMSVTGLQSSITWTSIFPGTQGQYNNYLSCTSNCSSTTVTPLAGSPAYIDYKVSGVTSCAGTRGDTIRVYTSPALSVPITPANPAICSNSPVTLTANPSGGNPPYTYSWSPGGETIATKSVTVAGTYTVTVNDNTTGCAPVSQAVTVAALPTPAAPTVAGTTICAGSTATLTATAPGGTYDWYDAPTGGNLIFTGSVYTTAALTSTTSYYVQTTLSGCPSNRTTVTVTVTPKPVAPTAAGTTICAGSTATLNASAPGGTYEWYSAASGGTLLQTANSYTTPSLNNTTSYYLQTTVSSCTSNRTTVTVNVTPIPAAPSVSDGAICSNSTITLNATAPGGDYKWYDALSGGTLLNSTAAFTTPTLTSTISYYVQTTVSGCTSSRSTVTVTVSATPPTPTVPATGTCINTSATLSVASPVTGVIYEWYTASSGGTALASGSSFNTPNLISTTDYYVQANLAGCGSSARTKVTVTVSSQPDAPTASAVSICTGGTASLNASAAIGTIIEWYTASSGGTPLQTGASYTTPALTNTTNYFVQTNVSGCTSTRTTVPVTVNSIPAAPTVASVAICSGSTATLQATAPGGTYQWYDAATGGTQLQSGTTTSFTSQALTLTTSYYVQTVVAGCTSSRSTVTVTVNGIPSAPAASAAAICAGSTATATITSIIGGVTYQWYDAASGGSLLSSGTSYTSAALNSSTNYYVQATLSGCNSSRTTVPIIVNSIPVAPSAASASICPANTTTLTATAPGGTYQWYDAATGGTLLQTGSNYTTPVLNASTNYYVQTSISGCTSSRTTVTVTVNPTPASPTVANIAICSGNTATLLATAPGGTYQWYDAVTGGNQLQSGTSTSYTSPTLTASTNYYVQTNVLGCTSSRTIVTVTVNAIPTAPTASAAAICAGGTATANITSIVGGVTYQWYDAPTAGNQLASGTSYTTNPLNSNTNYYVQANLSGCNSSRTAVAITVNPAPTNPTAAAAFICSGNTAVLTATSPGGTYQWYDAASGGNLLTTGNSYTTVALNTTTQYYVQTTVSGCTGTRTTVAVNVSAPPAAPTVLAGTICAGNSTSLTATAPGGTYQWYDAATGGNLLFTGSSYITPTLSVSSTFYVQTTVAGCTGPRAAATVSVLAAPAAPTASAASVCAGSGTSLTATAPGGSYQWYDAVSGGNLLHSGSVYTTAPLSNSVTYYIQTTVGACTGARSAVTVTVNPIPSAPSSNGGSICAGNTVSLNATGAAGLYQWYDSTVSGTLLSSSNTYTTPVLNNTTIYYVQTTVAGCTSARTAVTATVIPIQQPAFNYSSGTFCISGTNPTPTISGGAGGSFSATPAGLVFANTTTGTINLAASALGTYTIQYITGGQCVYSSSAKLTITNTPNAAFVYNGPYCPQQPSALPDFTAGASAGLFSSASAGLVFISTSTGEIDLQKSTPGTYNITNNIAAAGGCAAATAVNPVTIVNKPVASAGADITICAGTTASLTGAVSGTATNGSWSAANGTFTNAALLATQYKPADGETFVKLYLTTDDPAGPCIAEKDSLIIFINPLPTAPVVQNVSVCEGSNGTLTATAPGGTYEWFTTATGGTAIASGNTFTSPLLTTNVTYYVQSTINSCVGPRTLTSIQVAAKPSITSPATGEVCSANPFTYQLMSNQPGTNYTWSRPTVPGISNPVSTGITDTSITEVLINSTSGTIPVTYQIVPVNKGCTGDPFFYTASVKATPAAPAISNNTPVCAGSSLNLFTNAITGATYQWTGPNGFSSTQQNPVLTTVTTAAAGIYRLSIVVNGCASSPSSKNIAPVIAAPTATSNSPVCEQSTLSLAAGGLAGATYAWTGPSGFSSALQNPTLTAVKSSQAGTYYVTASIAGCAGLTDSVKVNISIPPGAPTVLSNSPVCSKDSITLQALNIASNAILQWSGPGGFISASATPSIMDAAKSNEGLYNVTVSTPGCAITNASSVSVAVNLKPSISAISNNSPLCEGDTLRLSATSFAGAGFSWSSTSGYTSSLKSPLLSNITKADETTYYVVASLNGCASDTAFTKVLVTKKSIATAGSNTIVCANNAAVQLLGNITGDDTQTGVWSSDGTGTFLPAANQLSAVYMPGLADTAKRKVVLTLRTTNNKVCAVSSSTKEITITPAPVVNAGMDKTVCANDSLVTLLGTIGNAGGGNWTSSGTGFFQSSGSSLSKIYVPSRSDITRGNVRFYLASTGNGNCAVVSDTVQYTIQPIPYVNAGNDLIIFENETIRLSPVVSGTGLKFLWTPSLNLSSDTAQNPLLTGKNNQTFTIRVTGTASCSVEDQVNVKVLKPFPIPNIFTPNGDGVHDVWQIPELANYPGASVDIFTRSGMKIFSSVGYQQPWDGTFNGKPVPVATYYYIIKANFRNISFSGSITIVR